MPIRFGATACLLLLAACADRSYPFDPEQPGSGPAALLGDRAVLNSEFAGGSSATPSPAAVTPTDDTALPSCDADCRNYCSGLGLTNPVDAAACRALWGVGLTSQPVDRVEACRRLHADLLGHLPTQQQIADRCGTRPFSEVVADMLADPRFVRVQQRHWADLLRYQNETVSLERIYDADLLVGMLYEGKLAYDEFAAVVSAHPVLTRRYDAASDRAEALFALLLGRPPYDHERADMARLYNLWNNGYYDHPTLGERLPDAVIRFRCLDDSGQVDPDGKGDCTSVLWGYKELILTPDYRSEDGELWSGLLHADEWHALQEPGRIIASMGGFWEHAAEQVLQRYLGYDLGELVPEVADSLVAYILDHNGDMRALHYAVATSQLYLQSNGGQTPTAHRHTYGPLKQIQVEPWLDTIKATTGYDLASCDHRLPNPNPLLNTESPDALALVDASDWELTANGQIRDDYLDLARTLGGCPDNGVGGRFTTISILTTATQEGFVARVCNPGQNADQGAAIERLLPPGLSPEAALQEDVARDITVHQIQTFFGREPLATELTRAKEAAAQCAPKPCSATDFARPLCYALLSSSELLFY